MLYGCVTQSPRACHYETLRRAHTASWLVPSVGERTIASTARFPIWTRLRGGERYEAIMRRRQILLAGFVARMKETGLPKCVMLRELGGRAGCVGWHTTVWMECLLDDKLSVSTPTSGRLQPRTREIAQSKRVRAGSLAMVD